MIERMKTLQIKIQLAKQAREFLVDKGYDPAYGARLLKRTLQKYIEDPVAEEILRNKFGESSSIKVKFNKKTETLRFVEGNPAKKKKAEPEAKQSADVT